MQNEGLTARQVEQVKKLIKEDGKTLFCSYGQPSSFWASPKSWVFVPRALVPQYQEEHDQAMRAFD